MSSIPGLRYQPHSRGNKPFVVLKDGSKKPRPFYLPDNDHSDQFQYVPTYKKNKAFARHGRLYQEQTATLDIEEEDEDDVKTKYKSNTDELKTSGVSDTSNSPRIITSIGLWSKTQRSLQRQASDGGGSVTTNISRDSFQSYPDSISSSGIPHAVFTRNRDDDEPIYATVIKNPLEASLSIPDDEEDGEEDIDRLSAVIGTSVKLTDEDTFSSGSFIRTTDITQQPTLEREKVSHDRKFGKIESLIITEEEDFGMNFSGLEDQNSEPFPSIYLSDTNLGASDNTNLRKRSGRGPIVVNRQSGAYLNKSWDRYSNSNSLISDNNKTEGIHIYPTISLQEVVFKEKSHSHSFPTLTLHHAEHHNGVRLHQDVPKVQNRERLSPAFAHPFERDSPNLAQGLSKQESTNNITDPEKLVAEVIKSEASEKFERTPDNNMSKDHRIEKEIDEDVNSEQTDSGDGSGREDMQEFYHGNQGFQDSILTPDLAGAGIPNNLRRDNIHDVTVDRRPSYMVGKCTKWKTHPLGT